MKRSELHRRKPIKRVAVLTGSLDRIELGRLAGIKGSATKRARAGIPGDAPQDKHGRRFVEKVCEVCGAHYLAGWSQAPTRRTCSRKCAGIHKRQANLDRKGQANPNYRHGHRVGDRDREGERRWYQALASKCANPNCPQQGHYLILHHIIYRQHIRRAGGDLWDTRNAMTLCNSCHGRYHNAVIKLPLSILPATALTFAVELLGAGPAINYLQRHYAGTDRRLTTARQYADERPSR